MTEVVVLVGGIDEGLQDVVHFLSRSPALLNHLEEDVLDLHVSSVPLPSNKKYIYNFFFFLPKVEYISNLEKQEVGRNLLVQVGVGDVFVFFFLFF